MFPRISIIILNWNGWVDTVECLESVYRSKYSNYDVIVVDNASRDDSIEKIKEYAKGKLKVSSKFFEYNPKNKPIKIFELTEEEALQGKFNKPLYEKYDPDRRLILIKNNKNYGYAEGNNKAIKFAISVLNPEFLLILNPDTVVDPNFLIALIHETDKKTGIAGPTVYFYDYRGRSDIIDFAGAILIPWNGKEIRNNCCQEAKALPQKSREVDKIEGSCMLIRKDVFLDIGLFDKSFFCYWEETDLNIRARNKGYKLTQIPSARIWHKIGSSTGGYLSEFYVYYFYRNRTWFIIKNYSQKVIMKNILYIILWEIWYKLVQYIIKHRKPKLYLTYLKAVFEGFSRFKSVNSTF